MNKSFKKRVFCVLASMLSVVLIVGCSGCGNGSAENQNLTVSKTQQESKQESSKSETSNSTTETSSATNQKLSYLITDDIPGKDIIVHIDQAKSSKSSVNKNSIAVVLMCSIENISDHALDITASEHFELNNNGLIASGISEYDNTKLAPGKSVEVPIEFEYPHNEFVNKDLQYMVLTVDDKEVSLDFELPESHLQFNTGVYYYYNENGVNHDTMMILDGMPGGKLRVIMYHQKLYSEYSYTCVYTKMEGDGTFYVPRCGVMKIENCQKITNTVFNNPTSGYIKETESSAIKVETTNKYIDDNENFAFNIYSMNIKNEEKHSNYNDIELVCDIYNKTDKPLSFNSADYFKMNNKGIIASATSENDGTVIPASESLKVTVVFKYKISANTDFKNMILTVGKTEVPLIDDTKQYDYDSFCGEYYWDGSDFHNVRIIIEPIDGEYYNMIIATSFNVSFDTVALNSDNTLKLLSSDKDLQFYKWIPDEHKIGVYNKNTYKEGKDPDAYYQKIKGR